MPISRTAREASFNCLAPSSGLYAFLFVALALPRPQQNLQKCQCATHFAKPLGRFD
jgi:hypothetical protein